MSDPNYQAPYNVVVNTFVVSQMLYRAYRMANGLQVAGQGISPSESLEGLDVLNAMIDGWKIENLLVNYYIRYIFPLSSGKKDYSVGPGGDFSMERLEKIHAAGFILQLGQTGESEIPIQVILDYTQYASEVAKNVTSSYPLVLYYQPSYQSNGLGTVTFWPVPNQTPASVALYNQAVLQEFTTVDDPVWMPKGYREMLQYNLAVRINQMPPYNKKPMHPTIYQMAEYYKMRVKQQQITPILMSSDPAVLGRAGTPWRGGLPKAWTPYS